MPINLQSVAVLVYRLIDPASVHSKRFVLLARVQVIRMPVSYQEFCNAVAKSGFSHPGREKYNAFVGAVDYAGIPTKRESAMFLAQMLHESGGFRYKEEIAYSGGRDCPYTSSSDYNGKQYYGRGYIQLTWAENYMAASRDIYGNDKLWRHPELVADDEEVAFKTAAWYWKSRVSNYPGVSNGKFGCSTRAINGVHECNGQNVDKSKRRFNYYVVALREFSVNERPNESGCYN